MTYLVVVDLLVAVCICDSQRFKNGFTEGGNVWANNSGPALFKWRFVRGRTDISPSNIKCYFENNGYQTVVIKKEGSDNPVVQTNLIQSTPLNGKVQGYVDSTDPTVFGFIISRVMKSDPKKYQCAALFKTYSAQGVELSTRLSLQVLDPPDLSRCLDNIQPARHDSTLTLKCYATGNPQPDVKCELWDGNNVAIYSEGPFKENVTIDIRGEDILLKLRKIVCYISAEKTGSYKKTTGEGQVLVLHERRIKDERRMKGAVTWGLIGGAAAGVALVLVILGLTAWFFKFKRNIGNEVVSGSDGNRKTYQKPEPPIYAEVGDPNYNLLMPRSCSYKTYQELQSAHTNLETNECSKNTAPVATDITSKEYVQMRPYVIC